MSLQDLPKNTPEVVLGFDYGTQNIGVAIGQAVTKSATPLTPLKAKDGIPNWDAIAALIKEWQPNAFVVGLPFNMDGSDSELSKRATKFANRLNGRFHLPSYGMDERLSSHEAEDHIDDRKKQSIDSVAASIIVEDWYRVILG